MSASEDHIHKLWMNRPLYALVVVINTQNIDTKNVIAHPEEYKVRPNRSPHNEKPSEAEDSFYRNQLIQLKFIARQIRYKSKTFFLAYSRPSDF